MSSIDKLIKFLFLLIYLFTYLVNYCFILFLFFWGGCLFFCFSLLLLLVVIFPKRKTNKV